MNLTIITNNLKEKTFSQISAEDIVGMAKDYSIDFNEDIVKNNQIRKFYDVVKTIERKAFKLKDEELLDNGLIAQLIFLKPHLVNAAKKKKEMKNFSDLMIFCLNKDYIKTKSDLVRFVKFFESIIAYIN